VGRPGEDDDVLSALVADRADGRTRGAFHRTLDGIDDLFTAAAIAVGEAMPAFHRAYLAGEEGVIEDARALARRTAEDMADVEQAAFVLLARESPVGRDLRRLVAILRLVHDVERSAALLRHVCETLRRVDPRTLPGQLRAFVEELGWRAAEVYVRGVEAWRRRDALAVSEVDELHELVDRLQLRLYAELSSIEGLGEAPLAVGLVTRYYERLADHAVTIARDTAFVATGDRVVAHR
jgi:phosphate transport system protein